MTIQQALIFGTTKLNHAKINSAQLDTEIILSFVLKKSKEFLFTYPENELTNAQSKKFQQFIAKRATHFPIAYITGHKEFYGLTFSVNKNVLIPRPETEILVASVLQTYNLQPTSYKLQATTYNLADIGTGSGCIIISLARHITHANFFAIDKSAKALTVAKKNARTIVPGKIKFYQGNLLTPIKNKKIDILVANLPYVESNLRRIIRNPESASLKYEPISALIAGHDGLSIYKRLLQQISNLKIKPQLIFLEIGDRQASGIKKLIKKNLPTAQIEIIQDLSGKNRVVKITVNHA